LDYKNALPLSSTTAVVVASSTPSLATPASFGTAIGDVSRGKTRRFNTKQRQLTRAPEQRHNQQEALGHETGKLRFGDARCELRNKNGPWPLLNLKKHRANILWRSNCMKFVKVYRSRAQKNFCGRKRCSHINLNVCATPHPDEKYDTALRRLQRTRLFLAMEDVVCELRLRCGVATGDERVDACGSVLPFRRRWHTMAGRLHTRLAQAVRFLPLIGLFLYIFTSLSCSFFNLNDY
jgi:hypothetical protein